MLRGYRASLTDGRCCRCADSTRNAARSLVARVSVAEGVPPFFYLIFQKNFNHRHDHIGFYSRQGKDQQVIGRGGTL